LQIYVKPNLLLVFHHDKVVEPKVVIMDIIMASSRGKGLEELIKPHHPNPYNLTAKFKSSA